MRRKNRLLSADIYKNLKYMLFAYTLLFLAQNLLMIPYYLLDEKTVSVASIDTANYFKNPFLMIVCIIVAPVLEELLFRKYLWNVLNRVFNEKIYSAFLSSCVFGFLHFSEYTLPLIADGLIFCWLYHKTEKIINNIIVHSSYNITLLLIFHFVMR